MFSAENGDFLNEHGKTGNRLFVNVRSIVTLKEKLIITRVISILLRANSRLIGNLFSNLAVELEWNT